MTEQNQKYAVVTTVSTFYHHYVVPMDELQKLNPDAPVEAEWLADSVTMEEVEEFSQRHVGEQILECYEIDQKQMLEMFDKENDYLKEWTEEQKLNWVRNTLKIDNDTN